METRLSEAAKERVIWHGHDCEEDIAGFTLYKQWKKKVGCQKKGGIPYGIQQILS